MSNHQTLEQLIRGAAQQLEDAGVWCGHGTDNALDEASWLVLHALGLPPEHSPDYSQRVEPADAARACAIVVERIERRVPAAYLTGKAWFCGLAFTCDDRALVPRSPIAELIQDRFQPWVDAEKVTHALDLCTGGGCIAIAMSHALPNALIDAADLSEQALSLARENVEQHDLEQRLQLHLGDLFSPLEGKCYDLIVSNPPYVDVDELNAMPDEYRAEPALGLAAGEDGLDITWRILRSAPKHLKADGVLVVEVGASMPAAIDAFSGLPLTWLEFENGGSGVFLIDATSLREALGTR